MWPAQGDSLPRSSLPPTTPANASPSIWMGGVAARTPFLWTGNSDPKIHGPVLYRKSRRRAQGLIDDAEPLAHLNETLYRRGVGVGHRRAEIAPAPVDRGRECRDQQAVLRPSTRCGRCRSPGSVSILPKPDLQRDEPRQFAVTARSAMPEPVYPQAAMLRARFSLKTPDALHLACAQHHRCMALWTNDNRLAQASHGLPRNILH